jgi:hypothetical protein
MRRRETLRMVEEAVRKEAAERKVNASDPAGVFKRNYTDLSLFFK